MGRLGLVLFEVLLSVCCGRLSMRGLALYFCLDELYG